MYCKYCEEEAIKGMELCQIHAEFKSLKALLPDLPKEIGAELKQTINARDLWEELNIESKFADWIKNRIREYGFIDEQDFTTVSKNLESGGRTIEYHITFDMAKELGMVEKNDKGKLIRQYFIWVEKNNNKKQLVGFQDFSENLALVLTNLANQSRQTGTKIEGVEGKVDKLQKTTENLVDDVNIINNKILKRKNHSPVDQTDGLWVVKEYFSCKCPICGLNVIVDLEGKKTPLCHFDHWHSKEWDPRRQHMCVMCSECNNMFKKEGDVVRAKHIHKFLVFQERLKERKNGGQKDFFE